MWRWACWPGPANFVLRDFVGSSGSFRDAGAEKCETEGGLRLYNDVLQGQTRRDEALARDVSRSAFFSLPPVGKLSANAKGKERGNGFPSRQVRRKRTLFGSSFGLWILEHVSVIIPSFLGQFNNIAMSALVHTSHASVFILATDKLICELKRWGSYAGSGHS
ncbi:hypothetical protein BDW02DRAFT_236588 [Decorospora gaudefroyi]|uniref:Uncharacterized protein n=1 Tax=Decorospora gaudefroyi TaxID=184978 RepID=A0A6A5KKK4_9PLEO|nr:hypothetical protein BDW02DRAFT_236588 [Decorospora gaudefroyi]